VLHPVSDGLLPTILTQYRRCAAERYLKIDSDAKNVAGVEIGDWIPYYFVFFVFKKIADKPYLP
jgi:hypothetical protein